MQTILLIDDEAEIRESMRIILSAAGYDVRVASNGSDGIAEFRRAPADLVITDMIMPAGHGLDVIRTLRSQFPLLRIMAISGGGNFGPQEYKSDAVSTSAYLAAATAAGAAYSITKPFDRAGLLSTVRAALQAPLPTPTPPSLN